MDEHYNNTGAIFVSVIKGVDLTRRVPTAYVSCHINLTENKIIKCVKQPYEVLPNINDTSITVKQRNFSMETYTVTYAKTYTLLPILLQARGYSQEYINNILLKIQDVDTNRNIKSGNEITF